MTTVPIRIRPWQPGDERLLARAGVDISPASLRARFLAGTPRLPETYLRHVAAAPRWQWDAQVALIGGRGEDARGADGRGEDGRGEHSRGEDGRGEDGRGVAGGQGGGDEWLVGGERLVGWAEFARGASPAEADIALLVLDRWQRRGVGSALLRSMLPRIVDAGVKILHADVELDNHAVRGLLRAVLGQPEGVPDPAAPAGPGHQRRLSADIADGLLHYMLRLDGQMLRLEGRP